MERPRELRAKCQAGKGTDPAWYVIHRRVSIYITWALLRLEVPVVSVSLSMMAVGLVGAMLVAMPSIRLNLAGFALLYVSFLLDKVDGEMARYHEEQSVQGILLDRLHHRLIEPCLFIAVAIHEVRAGGPSLLLAVGMAIALLANVIEEHQQVSPYILFKHLRETGSLPRPRGGDRHAAAWSNLAWSFRPLKLFRTFIVAIPAFAVCYGVETLSGRAVAGTYLWASAVGLAVYVVFQSLYYFNFELESELGVIVARLPDLGRVAAPHRGAGSLEIHRGSKNVEPGKSGFEAEVVRGQVISGQAAHPQAAQRES